MVVGKVVRSIEYMYIHTHIDELKWVATAARKRFEFKKWDFTKVCK